MIVAIISTDELLRGTNIESAVIPDYLNVRKIRSLEETRDKYDAFIDFGDAGHAIALAGVISRYCPSVGAVALNFSLSQPIQRRRAQESVRFCSNLFRIRMSRRRSSW